MSALPSRPKPYSKRKKICWCTPACGKLLTTQTRRQHYKALTVELLADKEDSQSEAEYHRGRPHDEMDFVSDSSGHGIRDQGDEPMTLDPDDMQYTMAAEEDSENGHGSDKSDDGQDTRSVEMMEGSPVAQNFGGQQVSSPMSEGLMSEADDLESDVDSSGIFKLFNHAHE